MLLEFIFINKANTALIHVIKMYLLFILSMRIITFMGQFILFI